MPRRKPALSEYHTSISVTEWFSNQLWNTSLIWVIGCFAAGIIFYVVTTSTLKTHSDDLAVLKNTLIETKKENLAEREKVGMPSLLKVRLRQPGLLSLTSKPQLWLRPWPA